MLPGAKLLFEETHNFIYQYSEKPFQLSSGKFSHHYFNCKKITLHPVYLAKLAEVIVEELLPAHRIPDPEAVGGLTLGADPVAYGISLYYLKKNRTCYPLIVRKESKEHGTKNLIEGNLHGVREVIVIDDVVTTGGSTLKAVQAFRSQGLQVQYGICIIDREEGGKEALEAEGVTLLSLWKKSDFLTG